jgi:hypothetical protein
MPEPDAKIQQASAKIRFAAPVGFWQFSSVAGINVANRKQIFTI